MILELNIGLDARGARNDEMARDFRAADALRILFSNAYTKNVLGIRRTQSSTEDTLVVSVQVSGGATNRVRDALHFLAVALKQDCIACYNATEFYGELIGPNAAAWGEFNPEYFIRFDRRAPPAITGGLRRGGAIDVVTPNAYGV